MNPSRYSSLHSACIERFWHLVCHKSSVPQNGSYLRVHLGQYDLFIHNTNGRLSCYVNKCPHRGSRIVSSLSGSSALQCPYHGWSFQPHRTCVPRSDTFSSSIDPTKARLDQWYLEEVSGFIFVALNPAIPLAHQIGHNVSDLLSRLGTSIAVCHTSQIIDFTSPWVLAVENALESYHVPKVHPSTLGRVGLSDGVDSLWPWASLWSSPISNKRLARLSSLLSESLLLSHKTSGYFSLYIFPFSMLSSTESLSFSLQLYQPSLSITDAKTSLLTSLYIPSIIDSRKRQSILDFYQATAATNTRIFQEDATVSSLVDPCSWSDQPLPYITTLEAKIDHFRQCCRKVQRL